MKRSKTLMLALAAGFICSGTVATDASAAFSGLTIRAMCATAANFIGSPWSVADPGRCHLELTGVTQQQIVFNLPVERKTSKTRLHTVVRARGTGVPVLGLVCQTTSVFNPDGSVFAMALPSCTSGVSPMETDLVALGVDLLLPGPVNIVVTATPPASVLAVSWEYTTNGT